MNRPGVAAVAECLCRQGKAGIAIFATRMSSRSSSGVFMEFSAHRRGKIHEGSVPSSPLPWIVHRRDWKDLRQAFSPLCRYSPVKKICVSDAAVLFPNKKGVTGRRKNQWNSSIIPPPMVGRATMEAFSRESGARWVILAPIHAPMVRPARVCRNIHMSRWPLAR